MEELKALLKRFWKADAFFMSADPEEAEKQIGNYEKLLLAIRDKVNELNIDRSEFEEMIGDCRYI